MSAPPAYDQAVGYPINNPNGQQQPGYNQYGQPQPAPYGVQPGVYGTPAGAGYQQPVPVQEVPPTAPGYPSQLNQGYTPSQNQDNSSIDEEGQIGYEENFGRSLNDKNIRRAFIRKVYLILTAQLFLTVTFIALFLFVSPLKHWVQRNSWFYYVSYATFLVTYITLICCPNVRRKTPGNYICLLVFTLAFSYMTATISSYYDTEIVLIAAGITCLVCLSITLFAVQTRFDFTMCAGVIFAASMVLFFFGFACIIVYATVGYSHILNCVYAGLAALLFCVFLAFDTQMVVGGRKHQISEEDYVYGAIQLYLDIVYIFLMLLTLVGAGKD